MPSRLKSFADLPRGVAVPAYVPERHSVGIVHIGPGAFHRAHQAVYTDEALAAAGGDWRISGIALRSDTAARELTPQNGLYTVLERAVTGTQARMIGAIDEVLTLGAERGRCMELLTAPKTRIVTLTVTEKGYGLDRRTGGVDERHPSIAADLAAPETPRGVVALLVRALSDRRERQISPFTVLSCDNIEENGKKLKGLLLDFARRACPDMEQHIAEEVAFPSSMVDRISPARSSTTLDEVETILGWRDEAAVEAESYRQWVIEDDFPFGRPSWEAGGALFVKDVRPYEAMKLRMLNGTHSLLSYVGASCGYEYIRDVMGDARLVALARAHLAKASATLDPVPGVDLGSYAETVLTRFANPHLAHRTQQIAHDGTEKLPQRIIAPAQYAIRAGRPFDTFALAVAAWMYFVAERYRELGPDGIIDPRREELGAVLSDVSSTEALVETLSGFPGLLPRGIGKVDSWSHRVSVLLARMLRVGMQETLKQEMELFAAK